LDGEKAAGPGKVTKDIRAQGEKVYYALNKPRGVLCTNQDPAGRPLAVQLIPEKRRIFCVGRLDLDTEGLILLTNDGELTNLLTHPRYGIPKTYIGKVDGAVSGTQIEHLKRGVRLAEGRTQGALVRIRKRSRQSSVLEIAIEEGLNRQVRRMLAAVGLKCRRLKRVRIGPLRLGFLPEGAFRKLSQVELEQLIQAAQRAARRSAGALAAPPEAEERPEALDEEQAEPEAAEAVTPSEAPADQDDEAFEEAAEEISAEADSGEGVEDEEPPEAEKTPEAEEPEGAAEAAKEAGEDEFAELEDEAGEEESAVEGAPPEPSRPRREGDRQDRGRPREDREQSQARQGKPWEKREGQRPYGPKPPWKKREGGEGSRPYGEKPPWKKREGGESRSYGPKPHRKNREGGQRITQ
jgi:23S rRNA pseudouridine2605 synthase